MCVTIAGGRGFDRSSDSMAHSWSHDGVALVYPSKELTNSRTHFQGLMTLAPHSFPFILLIDTGQHLKWQHFIHIDARLPCLTCFIYIDIHSLHHTCMFLLQERGLGAHSHSPLIPSTLCYSTRNGRQQALDKGSEVLWSVIFFTCLLLHFTELVHITQPGGKVQRSAISEGELEKLKCLH